MLAHDHHVVEHTGATCPVVADQGFIDGDAPAASQMRALLQHTQSEARQQALQRAASVYQSDGAINMADVSLLEMQRKASESILVAPYRFRQPTLARQAMQRTQSLRTGQLVEVRAQEFCAELERPRFISALCLRCTPGPIPAMARVLDEFDSASAPMAIAAWFESAHAWLDGQARRDMLEPALQQDAGLVAAAGKKGGWAHG